MAMFAEAHRPPEYQRFERPVPDWFKAAKLGIFLHWGVYSVPAWAEPTGPLDIEHHSFKHNPYAEWYANTTRIPGSPAAAHHQRTFGDARYYELLDRWDAASFDATSFIKTVKSTGARYFVPVTKHHDGVTLWDAPGSQGVNSVASGPQKDLISELATATRAAGLRFGVYYSGGLDWRVADCGPICEERGDSAAKIIHRPNGEDYARYAHAQTLDLIERYAPDVLWGDIEWPDSGKPESKFSFLDVLDHFYAAAPEGVVNDRFGDTHWDFRTTEYDMGAPGGGMFEHCRGVGYSFGYNQLEDETQTLDGPGCVKLLVEQVAGGGNLLLNIGLRADGTLPDLQARSLAYLGEWNAANGQAIFDTEPFPAGTVSQTPWIRWTTDGEYAYAITDAAGRAQFELSGRSITVSLPDNSDPKVVPIKL
jgi:alpha-L-fucosidase